MRLLLIRHGESVDNVAGLYAGSRDSPLTSHGVLQINRLGAHLAKSCDPVAPIQYIFTSNLRRAYETADAVSKALADTRGLTRGSLSDGATDTGASLKVIRLPELRERDYGSSEGKKYRNPNGLVQSDSETHDSMRIRVDRFLDSHLVPIVDKHVSDNITVAIVAHGIILGVILKALLKRFPKPADTSMRSGNHDKQSEFAAWSNTGVLQAKLEILSGMSKSDCTGEAVSSVNTVAAGNGSDLHKQTICLTIEFTNNVDHLVGLKKTRGGIGSTQFDSRQRTMDSFFGPTSKKRKLEDS
ncbi:phosphoglycerate mutase-like protein [Daldinia caldariorum]|uniref:phosphoglycerate mutase-like protein n=1 Tax=Daldinia caldariorum TaxID=326644 RepID=UPI002007F6AF|nr:phosphoglycerate mutase-like protein [Daldinia caldariorum]KAI1471749.1 phosphoglycerate mutase-like protein [Daldinia caldariorum]